MSCRNSDNDTGTFGNSDIPSFEIQTEDMDNPPYRALFVFIWHKALAKQSSQLKPTRAKFTALMELGIVWPPTWLELSRVGLNLIKLKFSPNSIQVFHRLAISANSRQVVLFLLRDYAVVFRQLNGFLQAGSTWRYRLAFGHPPMQVLILLARVGLSWEYHFARAKA